MPWEHTASESDAMRSPVGPKVLQSRGTESDPVCQRTLAHPPSPRAPPSRRPTRRARHASVTPCGGVVQWWRRTSQLSCASYSAAWGAPEPRPRGARTPQSRRAERRGPRPCRPRLPWPFRPRRARPRHRQTPPQLPRPRPTQRTSLRHRPRRRRSLPRACTDAGPSPTRLATTRCPSPVVRSRLRRSGRRSGCSARRTRPARAGSRAGFRILTTGTSVGLPARCSF